MHLCKVHFLRDVSNLRAIVHLSPIQKAHPEAGQFHMALPLDLYNLSVVVLENQICTRPHSHSLSSN